MATIPQLKQIADSLGIKYSAKVKKTELEALISAGSGPKNVKGKRIPHDVAVRLGLVKPTVPRNEPMSTSVREAYFRTTAQGGMNLTPKQARRLRQKANKLAA